MAGTEVVARGAVPHVELVADDGKPHRVDAVEQLAVGDRVAADIGRQIGGAPAVPAGAVDVFRGYRLSALSVRLRAGG
jgi:hypothetical protein